MRDLVRTHDVYHICDTIKMCLLTGCKKKLFQYLLLPVSEFKTHCHDYGIISYNRNYFGHNNFDL